MTWRTLTLGLTAPFLLAGFFGLFRAFSCPAGWRAWVCYQILRVHVFLFSRCRHLNKCTIPESGAAIVIANHTSPVDPMLVWFQHFSSFQKPRLRVIAFMMAKEYYILPDPIGWVCRSMESIPVERSGRDMAPVREALRRLQNGHLLGVFPEGGLNVTAPDEQLRAAGTGAAWLALKSGAPVIPVFIHNAPRSRSMVSTFLTRSQSRLMFGPPIDLSQWESTKLSQDVLADVTDHLMKTLAELGGLKFTPTLRE